MRAGRRARCVRARFFEQAFFIADSASHVCFPPRHQPEEPVLLYSRPGFACAATKLQGKGITSSLGCKGRPAHLSTQSLS